MFFVPQSRLYTIPGFLWYTRATCFSVRSSISTYTADVISPPISISFVLAAGRALGSFSSADWLVAAPSAEEPGAVARAPPDAYRVRAA